MLLRLLAGCLVIIALSSAPARADNASDIQALKDQLRAMQQKLDQLSAPQATGTATATGERAACC